MQQQRSTIESVPENVDINLGSFPLTDSMNQQAYLSNRIIQEGACSTSCMLSSESSSSLHAVGSSDESFNAWNFGQPRIVVNREGRSNFGGMDWSPSVSTSTGAGPSSAARQFEMHHNVLFPETAVPRNPNANLVHRGPSVSRFLNFESEDGTSTGAQFGNSMHLSGSSSYMDGRTGGCSTSLATWGSSSGKRKALEGTSGQSNASASSSGIPQAENFAWPNETPHGNSPDPMNLSSSTSWNSPSANFLEHLTPSTGLNVREAALESFPPLSITMSMGTAAAPGSFERRESLRPQQEPIPFNLSSSTISSLGNSRHHSGFSLSHRPGLSSNFLDARSTRGALANAGVSQVSQSSAIQAPQLPRNTPGFPWIGVQHLSDNLTGSFLPGGSRDGANSGSMLRYISDTPVVSSAAETRNTGQDPPSWDVAAGLTSRSQSSLPSSRRISQSLSGRPLLPPFIYPRPMTPEIRRPLESAPWDPESFDVQNSDIPAPTSSPGSSSSPEWSGGNLLGHRQPHHMPGYSTDRQGDELLAMSEPPLRAFTRDIEGRNRAIAEIRQVLNAMRRGENLRDEDYMLFEPLMFQGLAEIHDRHRDMRLDVDNMSYEELLELEERIGDVNTGLKEETIMKFLKQHKKQICTGAESVKDFEPCCICQEQCEDGEEIGELDCGHDFHVNCIKQWLMHKNLCPICKTTGLVT